MADKQREKDLFNFLKEKKQASVQELATAFFISTASVRRDLTSLEKKGLVKRTHGGAVINERLGETSVKFRRLENIETKEKTVQIALKCLPDFDTVFIDNSSTCFMLAEKMNFSQKTVVTNAVHLATYLSKKNDVTVVLLGGTLAANTNALNGIMTLDGLKYFKFDLALISCATVDGNETYELSSEAATIKRNAIARSRKKILLMDSKKFKKKGSYVSALLSDYNKIITDADEETVIPLLKQGYKVINR